MTSGAYYRSWSGVALPGGADRLDELTEYAVPMRYDELLDAEPLDREVAIAQVDEVEEWATKQLREAAS